MKRKRRRFSREFKVGVLREIENGTTQAAVCLKHDIHPVLVNKWKKIYETYSDALENIGRFIDDVYNKKRLHSSLGYKSPEAFEREVNINMLT